MIRESPEAKVLVENAGRVASGLHDNRHDADPLAGFEAALERIYQKKSTNTSALMTAVHGETTN